MIVGLGLDVVEVDRVAASLARFGRRFAERVLTPAELARMPEKAAPYVSGLFAAKEAGVKALGTGFRDGIHFRSVEIVPDDLGKPDIRFHGPAAARAGELGADRALVSITHGRDTAAAVVILERDPRPPEAAPPDQPR